MKDLIEALQIFIKYKDVRHPTHCEHDVMYIMGIEKEEVSEEDLLRLNKLGFIWSQSDQCFMSFRFGSA